jgi:DNA-binding cell septation regulator SpoVG
MSEMPNRLLSATMQIDEMRIRRLLDDGRMLASPRFVLDAQLLI